MDIRKNVPLGPYNTFGMDVLARHFCSVPTLEALENALKSKQYPETFILGGGSNIFLAGDLDALVLHIDLKGISLVHEGGDQVQVKIMAGENWHRAVRWSLDQGYGGLENLSLIPGNVGAAPIQNIGAYGTELKDVFESCEAVHMTTGRKEVFGIGDCDFGYRDSFFKKEGKGRYAITSVTLRLTKGNHNLNTSYGAITEVLERNQIHGPTIKDVSDAVIAIRRAKLPDPTVLGNSGSFFKNPVLTADRFKSFAEMHPGAPYYRVDDNNYKIPAGWLIEQCGLKGKRIGDAGVYEKQALVLVNHGNATPKDVLGLAEEVTASVQKRFGIGITPEVNIIGAVHNKIGNAAPKTP